MDAYACPDSLWEEQVTEFRDALTSPLIMDANDPTSAYHRGWSTLSSSGTCDGGERPRTGPQGCGTCSNTACDAGQDGTGCCTDCGCPGNRVCMGNIGMLDLNTGDIDTVPYETHAPGVPVVVGDTALTAPVLSGNRDSAAKCFNYQTGLYALMGRVRKHPIGGGCGCSAGKSQGHHGPGALLPFSIRMMLVRGIMFAFMRRAVCHICRQ